MPFLFIVLLYIFFVWGVLRLIVPHLGFNKSPVPTTLPPELTEKIAAYNTVAVDDVDFVRLAYTYVTEKYTGSRIKTITQFWKAFQNPLIAPLGFLPCTGQNYILRAMLVTSGRFVDADIIVKTTPLNFFVHQYLKITADGKELLVDPWAHFLGIPFGKRMAFFG